jgi:hypothetical protein
VNSIEEIERMSEAELREGIWRYEWESRDWQNHQRLRQRYAAQADELKEELRRRKATDGTQMKHGYE